MYHLSRGINCLIHSIDHIPHIDLSHTSITISCQLTTRTVILVSVRAAF